MEDHDLNVKKTMQFLLMKELVCYSEGGVHCSSHGVIPGGVEGGVLQSRLGQLSFTMRPKNDRTWLLSYTMPCPVATPITTPLSID